ncbi:MAG: CHC2 zinc finger domain-containing protein [Eubacteriales bacterium]|nr:CHC2 zinc finger domain-containing protein [Eubacteriales bacterium]
MRVFETIKAAVKPRQAAEHYGLRVLPNDMTYCPFHKDRHPSMKLNEDYFFCFGCGASGDVIDFAARLFGISLKDAAKKLAEDFASTQDRRHNQIFPTVIQSLPTIGSGSVFVFSGTICGCCVSGSCVIILKSPVTPSIPALPRL